MNTLDPFGMTGQQPEQIGRGYFASSPEPAKTWVYFDDLPEALSEALWERHRKQLAFPAGLDGPAGLEELFTKLRAAWDVAFQDDARPNAGHRPS